MRHGSPPGDPGPLGRGGRRGARAQPLPVRRAPANRRGGAGHQGHELMTTTSAPVVPPHVVTNPRLGAWIKVEDGIVCVQVGKVELGQGILTALGQIAADALDLPLASVRVVPASTEGPDQGLTAGSLSVFQSYPAFRHLGAVVRQLV